jgi:hypothetical protein
MRCSTGSSRARLTSSSCLTSTRAACDAGELREAEWENLETQADALRDQLRDAPDDVAVQSILDEARTQANTVQVSAATLNTAVCSVGEATTTTVA